MDMSTTFEIKEIIGGVIAVAASYALARKKFSFDNLEITKSDTERELIVLLREQIKTSNDDLIAMKQKYNDLEDRTKVIGKERDEAIQLHELAQADLRRYENKIRNLEEIINRLTDALEVTSAKLNNEIEEEEED